MSTHDAIGVSRVRGPGAGAFALLFGLEATGRAVIIVALPVQTLELVGSDEGVSLFFLMGSIASLSVVLLVPRLVGLAGRATVYTLARLLTIAALALFVAQTLPTQAAGFILRATGVAVFYAVMSMFVMDHIRRDQLGRSEPLRMFSIGMAWTIGPLLGVQIERFWGPSAPFVASAIIGVVLLVFFWSLRMTKLPIVARRGGAAAAPRPAVNPLVNIRAYLAQPRLLLALLHAMGRGGFWVSFTIYTPLYAVANGLGKEAGGLLVAIGSGFMLFVPMWGWVSRRYGVRRISLIALPVAAAGALVGGLMGDRPWIGAGGLIVAAAAMTAIDGYGNTLFFRACKPSQRTAMAPVFSAHRDLGDIGHAAIFAILLTFFPVQVVFVAIGVTLLGLTILMLRVHPRL